MNYTKISKIAGILTLAIVLTGCGETPKEVAVPTTTIEVSKEEVKESESQEKWIEAEGVVLEDTTLTCENPVEKTLFIKEEDWLTAVNSTDVKVIKDQEGNYDSDFFEDNALCYIPKVSSGGMDYQLESVSLQELNGKNVLTVYASYSNANILNTQNSYGFFIELDKKEVSNVEEINLEVYERE